MSRMECAIAMCILLAPAQATAVSFTDDFQSGTLSAWQCNPCDDWSVTCASSEGTAIVIQPFQHDLLSTLCVDNLEWSDFQFDVDLRGVIPTDKMVRFRCSPTTGEYYYVNLRSAPANDLWLSRYNPADGVSSTLGTVSFPHDVGDWHHLTIKAEGGHFRVWINNVLRINANDPAPLVSGTICLGGWTGAVAKCGIQWDNVAVIDLVTPTGFTTWGQIKARY